MNLQWLTMRITEEQERRQREDNILKRLPNALEGLHASLTECLQTYTEAFGPQAASIEPPTSSVKAPCALARRRQNGRSRFSTGSISTVISALVPRFSSAPRRLHCSIVPIDSLRSTQRDG